MRDGAVIKDTRGLIPTKIFKTKSRGAWSCPGHNGIYELLKLDGTSVTCVVITSPGPDAYSKERGRSVVIPLDDAKSHVGRLAPHNMLAQEIPLADFNVSGGATLSHLSENRTTVILDTNGNALFVSNVKPSYVGSGDSVIVYAGDNCRVGRGLDSLGWVNGDTKITQMVQIPARGSLRVSGKTLYVPETAKFFEVGSDSYNPMELATVDEYIDTISRREKLLSIKLFSANDTVVVSDETGRATDPLSKIAAAHDLVKNYAILPEVAGEMIKEAAEAKQVRYLAKMATSSTLAIASGDSNPSEVDVQTIDLNGKLSEDARKTIQDASNTGVKEIMDVSVLKMLADDSSSVRIIQDLLPQLFGAMNAVGQLLFMVRASTSMSDAYGEARSTEMEKQFTTLMQRLGDVVIALQRGRIDDVSDLLEGKLSATLG